MNKLLEFKENFIAYFSHKDMNQEEVFLKAVKFAQDFAIEYAKSVIPEKLEMPTGDAMRFAYDKEHYTGYNHCIRETKANIEEDLQSLKK